MIYWLHKLYNKISRYDKKLKDLEKILDEANIEYEEVNGELVVNSKEFDNFIKECTLQNNIFLP